MIHRFILNEVSYFGPGARKMLPQEIKRLGLHKALVATDKELIRFGVAQKVLDVLEEAGVPYELFSEIKPNPTVSNVKAGERHSANRVRILFWPLAEVRQSIRPKPSVSSPTILHSVM